MCVCVCVGGGYWCKIWGGGGVCSTVLSETLIQLQIFDFCCSKEQNTVYFTHSQTHPLGKKLKPKLLIPSIALTKE